MDILIGPDGTEHSLSSDVVTIGRDSSNTISIADDYMSSFHATIERQGNAYVLSDLNSTSGTFVNNQRIGQKTQLSADDEIRMGQSLFRYKAAVGGAVQAAAVICPNCGSEARAGAKFCAVCGNALKPEPPVPPFKVDAPAPTSFQPSPEFPQSPGGQPISPSPTSPQNPPGSYGQQASYSPSAGAQPPVTSPQQNVSAQQAISLSQGAKPARVQFGEALKFPFSSNTWFVNLLIGAFLMLIPIIGQLLTGGYALDVMRRVIEEDYDALPEWDNWAQKLQDGVAGIGIPIALFVMLFIPLVLPGLLLTYLGAEDIGVILTGLGSVLLVALLYFVLPFVLGRYVATNSFTTSLQMREVYDQIRCNFGRYFGNWALTGLMLVAGVFIISMLTTLATALVVGLICGLPLILASTFYMMLVQYHLMGQLYRTVN